MTFTIEEEAKAIVLWSFRNNPTLENIHEGEESDIPDNISRIKEEEMKKIMKYAVDEVSFYLWLKMKRPLVYKTLIYFGLQMTTAWDRPRNPWNMYQNLMKSFRE